MPESGRTMPNKDDILALARWLNESTSDLISDVMARHTGTALEAKEHRCPQPRAPDACRGG